MHLQWLDWVIVAISLAICFVPALFFGKRASKGTAEFFASGRSVPWWLAGLSMVATTFSSDTPNLVTDIVRRQGVAGNWCWWAFVLTGVATVFFFARLWRRSGVMTDLEFYEIRYSGKAAGAIRGFRAVYLGLFFNCIIMASVNLAAVKIANVLFGLSGWQTLLMVGLLNVVFAAHSGLWGVLVIDMIQFFIKMSAVIAAAYFAVKYVGGLGVMVDKVSQLSGPIDKPVGMNYLDILPSFDPSNPALWEIAVAVFVMPILVQWWATWYPGAEPGGGSYIAQRMLASKSERDSLGGVLFFNIAHYVLRPWPWILVGLCSLLVFPTLGDIKAAFPDMDPKLLHHDIAYPAMLCKVLPVGWMGLMVGGLIAANSSTILTHLNWGASYLVHDFYRRFIKPGAQRAALRHRGADRHGRPIPLRRRDDVLADLCQGQFRSLAASRRRHGTDLHPQMVLVADQRVVRGRGDGQLVRRFCRHPGGQSRLRHCAFALRLDFHDRRDHGVLASCRVLYAANRPPEAD